MHPDSRPHAPACDRNQAPIADVLRRHLNGTESVLEVGSGTGQHAVYFTGVLPSLRWQCSDVSERLAGIRAWLVDADAARAPEPLAWDVLADPPPHGSFDAVFTANTFHIMPWAGVQAVFAALPGLLAPGGLLLAYGPFNRDGQSTADSNAAFDADLRRRDPAMGIRDDTALHTLAASAGLASVADHAMPANNRTLVWQRSG